MEEKVRIVSEEETLFEGHAHELPFRESAIKQKSLELFDEEDPCILHRSFVFEALGDEVLEALDELGNDVARLDAHEAFAKIDIEAVEATISRC